MKPGLRAYLILAVMPAFFVSNLVIGRPAVEVVPPWTLACVRWSLACVILAPFGLPDALAHRAVLTAEWRRLALLGFLGMWICGGIVYVALEYTTATHGTLIYTMSPVLVVLIAALRAWRPVPPLQAAGIVLSILSVFVIVLQGRPADIFHHEYNFGDLLFVGAAIAWAFYSLLLKHKPFEPIPTLAVFFAIAVCGAAMLWPCMIVELALGRPFPTTARAWASIAGLVIIASVFSYSAYQYGVKAVGPAITSIFMYLLPCYGVALAAIVLGEELHFYHAIGLALAMAGLMLATGSSLRDAFKAQAPARR